MLFRVRGSNKDTGAMMVIDVEAASKAAATYKAEVRGMVVDSLEDITAEAGATQPTSKHRGEGPPEGSTPDAGGTRNLVIFGILIVALVIVLYFTLPLMLQRNVPPPPVTPQSSADQ